MPAFNPNQCSHPFGKRFYHLGHQSGIKNLNQGVWIHGERIQRKATLIDFRRGVHIQRAAMMFVDSKYIGENWMNKTFICQLLFNAVMTKQVGTAFAIRCLNYFEREDDGSETTVIKDTKIRIKKHGQRLLNHYKRAIKK